jgi:hypothetical protein
MNLRDINELKRLYTGLAMQALIRHDQLLQRDFDEIGKRAVAITKATIKAMDADEGFSPIQ